MKKYIVTITLIVGFYLMFWAIVNFSGAQEAQKEIVTLESSMGNVALSHKKHTTSVTCDKCHHNGIDQPKCNNCHTKDSKVNAMSAFHKNCIDCHKEKQAGPTGCTDCHKK